MVKDPVCGMDVNESKAISVAYQGKSYYFCSKHCLDKFSKERGITQEKATCATCKQVPFYRNKNFIVILVLGGLIALSFFIPTLLPFRHSLFDYFKRIWLAVFLGLLLGGVIDHFVPREYISYLLARPGKKSIFYSVILGFLMSACSHGILALSIELHKKGASNPAVVSFLLASPWANMPLTIMLFVFFGFKGLYIVLCAIVIALITGFIYQFLSRRGLVEKNINEVEVDKSFSMIQDIKNRSKQYKFTSANLVADIKGVLSGAVSLGDMVLWWILIGMAIASLAGAYIPADVFKNYMGPTMLGLLVTLLLATVIEVCSEGSAPMAFEIFKQTGALGNSFVFLMAGVVTDYTEIGLLWHNVGRRIAIFLPIITVPQVVLLGYIANIIFK